MDSDRQLSLGFLQETVDQDMVALITNLKQIANDDLASAIIRQLSLGILQEMFDQDTCAFIIKLLQQFHSNPVRQRPVRSSRRARQIANDDLESAIKAGRPRKPTDDLYIFLSNITMEECAYFLKFCNYDKAIEYGKRGIQFAKEVCNVHLEVIGYQYIMEAYLKKGNLTEAKKYCKELKEMADRMESKAHRSKAFTALGRVLGKLGKIDYAFRYLSTSLSLNNEIGRTESNDVIYNSLASIYIHVGEYKHAKDASLNCLKIVKNPSQEQVAYRNLSIIYERLNNSDYAGEYRWQYLVSSIESGAKTAEIKYFEELSVHFCNKKMRNEAIKYAQKSIQIAKAIQDLELIGHCYRTLGYVLLKLKEVDLALEYFRKALGFLPQIKDSTASCLYSIGLCYCHLAPENYAVNIRKAEHYFKKSIRTYESIFVSLRDRYDFKISIVDKYVNAYTTLTSLLIKESRAHEALVICDRSRACCLRDIMVSTYGMETQQSTNVILDSDDLSDIVPDKCCIVVYSIPKDQIRFWVLTQKQTEVAKQTNSARDISQLITSVHQLLQSPMEVTQLTESEEDRNVEPQLKENLEELHNQLITPIQEHLIKEELVIAPEKSLYMAPYSAFKDHENGKYLCQQKCIRIVPSLATLKILKENPPDYDSCKRVIAIVNPTVGKVMCGGKEKTIKNQSVSKREVGLLNNHFGDSLTVLTKKNATKDAVKKKIHEKAAIIILSAHGEMSTGALAFAPGISAQNKDIPDEEDYLVTMHDVQENGIHAPLVILRSCYGAKGEIRSEGVVGIARAFIAAGARAVVATLWAIQDRASFEFMRHFYNHLKHGKSASVSLNIAMKKMIKGEKYSHPKYWAPFVLIGDDVKFDFQDEGTAIRSGIEGELYEELSNNVDTDYCPRHSFGEELIKSSECSMCFAENYECHQSKIDNYVKDRGMKRQEVAGDGHCILHSFLLGLQDANYNKISSVDALLPKIRNEILHENKDFYLQYVGDIDLQKELDSYLETKRFDSDVVDLMLHVLANITSTSVLLYQVIGNQVETLRIDPHPTRAKSQREIHLCKIAFHYDAIIREIE